MLILDGESNDIVEKFSVNLIQSPISFNYRDHMYNNILIFTVQHPNETQGNWMYIISFSTTFVFNVSLSHLDLSYLFTF